MGSNAVIENYEAIMQADHAFSVVKRDITLTCTCTLEQANALIQAHARIMCLVREQISELIVSHRSLASSLNVIGNEMESLHEAIKE
jgi:hypothetical protein